MQGSTKGYAPSPLSALTRFSRTAIRSEPGAARPLLGPLAVPRHACAVHCKLGRLPRNHGIGRRRDVALMYRRGPCCADLVLVRVLARKSIRGLTSIPRLRHPIMAFRKSRRGSGDHVHGQSERARKTFGGLTDHRLPRTRSHPRIKGKVKRLTPAGRADQTRARHPEIFPGGSCSVGRRSHRARDRSVRSTAQVQRSCGHPSSP